MAGRVAARVDSNHAEIVAALRRAGYAVQSLATVGKGCPDLLVANEHMTCVMEVKTEKGKLTPAEEQWLADWPGFVAIVRSVDEALAAAGMFTRWAAIVRSVDEALAAAGMFTRWARE